ncbi:hypothetical protein RGR602_CH03108 [Rhizobium gallicum bv. gallicum R602sp]|uniref:Uncharacterized protein n=1 Tax=Rhizobium gallicum bv. gallicum R602sp TaxID=1041138 RepID=A0A0B4X6T4_9HYPH|nr:hypothetical protein RGR602_CH03108 [Rhizobium gallicum bv. gallicum R602sp]
MSLASGLRSSNRHDAGLRQLHKIMQMLSEGSITVISNAETDPPCAIAATRSLNAVRMEWTCTVNRT